MLIPSSVERVFDHSPLGALVIDEAGLVANANRASARMFRCPVDELIGGNLSRLACPEEQAHLVARLMARVWPPRSAQRWFRRLDGTPLVARTTSWPLEDAPSGRRAIVILEDLSCRSATGRPISPSSVDAGLVAAALAHEVRNPITGITGALRVIRERLPDGAPEREVLEQAHARLVALDQLVDDLYIYARIREPAAQKVSIAAVLEAARDHLKTLPDLADFSVSIAGDVVIGGDAPMLLTLFQRLVRTAARASNGLRRLDVHIDQHDRLCAVTLTLKAATATVAASLRDGFGRGDLGCSAPVLDLLMARQIAIAHGGEIEATWENGATRIVVSLPVP